MRAALLILMLIVGCGCGSELQQYQSMLGAVVPYADAEGQFNARASVEHVYVDASGGARVGLHIDGLGQVWEVCRGTETFECSETAQDPGVGGEWVYDILIWEDGQGRRRLQMRPTPAGQVQVVRHKLGLPAPLPTIMPRVDVSKVLPESPVFALPGADVPTIVPPPPPPPHVDRM